MDWSSFIPPVDIIQYVMQRCVDFDGDSDGDGELEYDGGGTYPCDTFHVEGGKDIPVPSEVNKAIEWLKLKCLKENDDEETKG